MAVVPPHSSPNVLQLVLNLFAFTSCTLAIGGGLGVGAIYLQEHFSPLLLFPCLWGLVLGLAASGVLLLSFAVPYRVVVVGVTTCAALCSLGFFHYVAFLKDVNDADIIQQKLGPNLPAAALAAIGQEDRSAKGVFDYLQREANQRGRTIELAGNSWRLVGWQVWTLWGVEAALVLVGALVIVLPASRLRPFSPRTGSWYRLARSGQFEPEIAAVLFEQLQIDHTVPDEPIPFRLFTCAEGDDPDGLELEFPSGREMFWLNPQQTAGLWATVAKG